MSAMSRHQCLCGVIVWVDMSVDAEKVWSVNSAPTKLRSFTQAPVIAIVANDPPREIFSIPELIQLFTTFGFTPILSAEAGAKLKMTRINFSLAFGHHVNHYQPTRRM
jgi:hypothetical protein